MKRGCVLISLIAVILSAMVTVACAVGPEENVVDLGDGFYVVERVFSYSLSRSGDMVYGGKSGNVYYGSTLIGTATLNATFDISGSAAKAVDAFMDGSGRNGGTYMRGTTRCSGNTASGTAYFSYSGAEKTVRLSVSCSPNGTIS